jgi:hypothetical protein
VDAVDRRNIPHYSVDRLSLYHEYATSVDAKHVGAGYQLVEHPKYMVLDGGNIQAVHVADGDAGRLADALGAAIKKGRVGYAKA